MIYLLLLRDDLRLLLMMGRRSNWTRRSPGPWGEVLWSRPWGEVFGQGLPRECEGPAVGPDSCRRPLSLWGRARVVCTLQVHAPFPGNWSEGSTHCNVQSTCSQQAPPHLPRVLHTHTHTHTLNFFNCAFTEETRACLYHHYLPLPERPFFRAPIFHPSPTCCEGAPFPGNWSEGSTHCSVQSTCSLSKRHHISPVRIELL
jgi:hypothetical protein